MLCPASFLGSLYCFQVWLLGSPPAAEERWLQDYKVRQRHIPFLPPPQQALLGPGSSCAPLPGCPVRGCTAPALPLHSSALPSPRAAVVQDGPLRAELM